MGKKTKDESVPKNKPKTYIEQVEHAVERLDTWSKKLVKLSRSRKSDLTTDERKTIASTVGSMADSIGEALTRPEQVDDEPSFRLR